jgi:hypothetical protein
VRRPLPLFLQLDLADLPAELGQPFGAGLLQLFYCTRDDCQGYGGWEPFADDLSRVRVVHPTGTCTVTAAGPFPGKRIVGWSRFIDLPDLEEHPSLGLRHVYDYRAGTVRLECPELGLALDGAIADDLPERVASSGGDKLAGWPYWVQGVEYPCCPRCGQRMVLVFQLDSNCNLPFMFGDVGCGHITQCPEHKEVVAFGWACC